MDLGELLAAQCGVLTAGQAAEHGISRHGQAHRVASGRWQRAYPGVFATVTGGLDIEQRIWAAYLYAGPGATIGFRTAWWLADRKLAEPDVVHVVVPDPRIVARQPGLVIRRTRRWPSEDLHPSARPRRFRIERAVLDCASTAATEQSAIALLASSVQRRTTTVPRLREVLQRHPNLPRRALLVEVLALAAKGAHSLLEVLHEQITASHGLPSPDRQRRIEDTVVDGLYECPDGSQLAAEFDGQLGHFEADGWWKDMSRDNGHTIGRIATLRFPGFVLLTHPHTVAATIAEALTARGWTGTLRCPRNCPGPTYPEVA
ncbi:MAG TPA: type IV toxin-antitoxin system AbiEi family antitoxin domain-containing protein [Frankiaceae bacterium]|nr:type IV toxin-antitoxin system AbiEi family antitoxin domain-containing protein [Frankiaceae bacterium]